MVTIPGFVPSAGPKVIVLVEIEAPFTIEVPEKVPTVVTPPPVVQAPQVGVPAPLDNRHWLVLPTPVKL